MLLTILLLIPILGVLGLAVVKENSFSLTNIKFLALTASISNLFLSLILFIVFDSSTNQFQFVQELHEISNFNFYLGVDGLSIFFILLTTIIIPISLLSNWISISTDVDSYVYIILLLETLLLAVFLVLDILLFYIFFESILPPLFILIGIFGSDNRVKASFYLFLYTLLGSLFLLLSILAMSSTMCTTDFDTLFKGNFAYITQLFLFYGIFIAFAVKTPTIFLNTWLLKAHVESPLGGSIILAAIVLKLSLYGILRLILPVLPKGYMEYTYIIYLIGVITIIYASLSTLRTIDVKELIAYSSVSHAAVYLLGVFSNSIQGIEGSINLGLAHGLVSPGLFICAGGILYDRSHTRLIALYRGMTQIMPLFAIFFFILCLANCGAPLSLNFIGEFLSLYGVFERSSLFGLFASLSIIFSAAYTMYMYQKISFGGSYSRMFTIAIPDLNKREFMVLLTLVVPTVLFGIYPAPILDAIHYSVSTLIYSFDSNLISCYAPNVWEFYFQYSTSTLVESWLELVNYVMYYSVALLCVVCPKILSTTFSILHGKFTEWLNILKGRLGIGLDQDPNNTPTPHTFTSLELQSSNPFGPLTNGNTPHDTRRLAATNHEGLGNIIDCKERREQIRELDEIIVKNPQQRTQDDMNKWNATASDPTNLHLKQNIVSLEDQRREIKECTQTINMFKDEIRANPDGIYIDDQISDNEYVSDGVNESFIVLLPINYPILSILLLVIRNWRLCPFFRLYVLYLKDILYSNSIAIVMFSFTMTSFILFVLNSTVHCEAPIAWELYFQYSTSTLVESWLELVNYVMYYSFALLCVVCPKILSTTFSILHGKFTEWLNILKGRLGIGLDQDPNNTPTPHTFTSLELQSSNPFGKGGGSSRHPETSQAIADLNRTNRGESSRVGESQDPFERENPTQAQSWVEEFNRDNTNQNVTAGSSQNNPGNNENRDDYSSDSDSDSNHYVALHEHQLSKYNEDGMRDIAQKGDRGEPLTPSESDKWESADQDIDGESGHLGEPSSTSLDQAIAHSRSILENNGEIYENILLPLLGGTLVELPVIRGLFIVYSLYKTEAFSMLKLIYKNYNVKPLTIVFLFLLSINYYCFDRTFIHCHAPDAWEVYFNAEPYSTLFYILLVVAGFGLGLAFSCYNHINNYVQRKKEFAYYNSVIIITYILFTLLLLSIIWSLGVMIFNLYRLSPSVEDIVNGYQILSGDLAKVGHTDVVQYYPVGIDSTVCLSTQGTGSEAIDTKPLPSDKGISEVVKQINFLMPQLSNFINQFNNTVNETGIHVLTDSEGNMSIDVPNHLSTDDANKISTRIGIIDRLITTRGQEINELLHKGTLMESKIKMENPNYVSQLTDKIEEFKKLNKSYNH